MEFVAATVSLNSVNQSISVTVRCGVFLAVRTEFLNNIFTSFDFTGLKHLLCREIRQTGHLKKLIS
jgi:hypothetical protein